MYNDSSMYIFDCKLPRDLFNMRSFLVSVVNDKKKELSIKFYHADKVISSLINNAVFSTNIGQNEFYITLDKGACNYVKLSNGKTEKILFSYKAFITTIQILEDLGYLKLRKGGRSYSFYASNKIKGGSGYIIKESKASFVEVTDKFIELLPLGMKKDYIKMSNTVTMSSRDVDILKVVSYPQYYGYG